MDLSVKIKSKDTVCKISALKNQNLGGKTPLSIYRGCFDAAVDSPCFGTHKNAKQTCEKTRQIKKRKSSNAVKRDYGKTRTR
eukprot:14620538-Ditylum_brightwellii.AAC.1